MESRTGFIAGAVAGEAYAAFMRLLDLPSYSLEIWHLGVAVVLSVVGAGLALIYGATLGTLLATRGSGGPEIGATVTAAGSSIVYVVKPYVFDRIDKKAPDFRDPPKPTPTPA